MSAGVTAREFVRHVLFKTSTYRILNLLRAWKGQSMAHLGAGTLNARFDAVYEMGIWQHGSDQLPGSGVGSTVAGTANLREKLPALLDSLGVKTLLDIGCGDFSWMQHVLLSQQYIGVDVVKSLISRNHQAFGGTGRVFKVADATVDALPEADAVLCREVLFHLCFADIRKLIANILAKKRAYLLLTTDRGTSFNSDIPTGDYRLLNLEASPFRLPSPLYTIDDPAGDVRRVIGVWESSRLQHFSS